MLLFVSAGYKKAQGQWRLGSHDDRGAVDPELLQRVNVELPKDRSAAHTHTLKTCKKRLKHFRNAILFEQLNVLFFLQYLLLFK